MGWLGKLIGGTIGFAFGGPVGGILGATFGHAFDANGEKTVWIESRTVADSQQAQRTFYVALFSMLAKLTKADGKISDPEIAVIEKIMRRDLKLNDDGRRIAIKIFHSAIQSPESFQVFATQFYRQFSMQPQMLEVIVDIFLQVSSADGRISPAEETLMLAAVEIFQISPNTYYTLKKKYVTVSDNYYTVLGCTRNDSDDQIKRQYRKLAFEYHPDRIASKQMPDEFMTFSKEKFQEIQAAYEAIKKERRM